MLLNIQYVADSYRLVFDFENISFCRRLEYAGYQVYKKIGFFGKREENQIFKKIQKGKSHLLILPQQSKKSFYFWLPEFYSPGTILIIAPQCALMRNLNRPLNIRQQISENSKIACAEISIRKNQILFMDPENLKIKDFSEQIKDLLGRSPLHSLIIDRIHAISEWRHDFSPFYLKLPGLISELKEINPKLTLIGITDAPEKLARRDIINSLALKEEDMSGDSECKNFIFAVPSYASTPLIGHAPLSDNTVPKLLILPKYTEIKENEQYSFTDKNCFNAPSHQCEADMQRRNSFIPRCLSTCCKFEETELCDYGREHLFILKTFPDIEDAVMETLRILDRLISLFTEDSDLIVLNIRPEYQRETEAALHRLSVLGLIQNFSLDYQRGNAVFEVKEFPYSPDDACILNNILNYLKKNDLSSTKKYSDKTIDDLTGEKGDIARQRELHAFTIWKRILSDMENGRIIHYDKYPLFYDKISEYLLTMLGCLIEDIKAMQYQRLWNLKEHIKRPKPRRSDDNILKEWLQNDETGFDFEMAEKIIQGYSTDLTALYIQSSEILKDSPRNIKAIYLACKSSPQPLKEKHLHDLLRVVNRDSGLSMVKEIYSSISKNIEKKSDMSDILDDEYGALNTIEGEKWLYDETKNLSAEPLKIEMLGARVVLNKLMQTDISEHKSKLTQMLKEL